MIALTGGKILPVAGDPIEKGTVLVEDGKIKAVGANLEVPAGAQVVDVTGMWVTPGLIDAHTHISVMGEPAPHRHGGRQRGLFAHHAPSARD